MHLDSCNCKASWRSQHCTSSLTRPPPCPLLVSWMLRSGAAASSQHLPVVTLQGRQAASCVCALHSRAGNFAVSTLLRGRYTYSSQDVLGEGRAACVYKAVDRTLGKSVALKIYHDTDRTRVVRQVVRQYNPRLDHGSICSRRGCANTASTMASKWVAG